MKFRALSSIGLSCLVVMAFQNCVQQRLQPGLKLIQQGAGLGSTGGGPQYNEPADPDAEMAPVPVSPLPPPKPGDYATTAFNAPFAIVYIRIPRVTETMDYLHSNGVRYPASKNWDLMQTLPETTFRTGGMSGPGQLIYRDRAGKEKILYDCMTTNDCLPMDPSVSFDGKKVIFSVLYGQIKKYSGFGQTFPFSRLSFQTEAKLFMADIASGLVTPLAHVPGAFDTGPVFLPDGKIMFTSDRAKELPSSHFFFTPDREPVLQMWIANEDGSDANRVGPHDRDGVLHPFVMTDGRVLFSTWQINHLQAHTSNNGAVGGPSAKENKFWLAAVDHTGGNWNAVLGSHGEGYSQDGNLKMMKALHFVTEATNKWLCTTDYYRANNFGAGQIVCWEKEETGIEGRGPSETDSKFYIFTPRKMMGITRWGGSQDEVASIRDGKYTGKVRDPMALPGNQLLLTFMKGPCSKIQEQNTVIKMQAEPFGCDGGIYYTTQIPSLMPSDLVKVVDLPEWQEFMARVAEPYSFIYGKSKPDLPVVQRDSSSRCVLASSSMEGEVQPTGAYNFLSAKDCAIQGCKSREIPMDKVKAIRFWQVLPNMDPAVQKARLRSTTGNVHKLLGDVPLNSDGSFAAEIPCDTPYVMAGVDADGNTFLRDQVPQSLRRGEVRTCTGCHLHSRPGRPMEESMAFSQMKNPFRVGFGSLPTLQKGKIILETTNVPSLVEYKKDIYPILQNRCASCHSGATAAKGLRFDIPGTSIFDPTTTVPVSTWYRIAWDYRQKFVPDRISYSADKPTEFSLEKPFTSKYMNSAFAIESPLLWKFVNRRLDGRTDASYPSDIDFGPEHPTTATEDEIRIIRDWIDAGAYGEL